ncbi:MAG: hypothetical protein OEX03_00725, partial [Gammaproteobacteria bacterium]|nr:hypothetical protein [Gammaproteobacteria bacterium]
MYQCNGNENLIDLEIPLPYRDAPLPILLADELNLILSYVVADSDEEPDSTGLGHLYEEEPMLAVKFQNPLAHFQGPPDDGGIQNHPLAAAGLQAYGIYVVENSPWVEQLRVMQIRSGLYRASDWVPLKHYLF